MALTPTHGVFMNLFFRCEVANFSQYEHMVHQNNDVASKDRILLETYVYGDWGQKLRNN